MFRDTVSADDVIRYLNELVEIDPLAIRALMCTRIPCNEALANHPTVQVSEWPEGCHVGVIGIINGLFGTDEEGRGGIGWRFAENEGEPLLRFIKPSWGGLGEEDL